MRTNEHVPCFECGEAFYEEVVKDYQSKEKDGTSITVPNIKHMVCHKCGDTCLDGESLHEVAECLESKRRNRKAKTAWDSICAAIEMYKAAEEMAKTNFHEYVSGKKKGLFLFNRHEFRKSHEVLRTITDDEEEMAGVNYRKLSALFPDQKQAEDFIIRKYKQLIKDINIEYYRQKIMSGSKEGCL